MAEGLVEEGLKIVAGARQRYEGYVRNPFNEYECGNYYARAMSSYALLAALSGRSADCSYSVSNADAAPLQLSQ